LVALIARSPEVLAVERCEVDAVCLVSDQQVQHLPDGGEAAFLAWEAADRFGAFHLAERALEQVSALRRVEGFRGSDQQRPVGRAQRNAIA
jgi:hypothetical protein